MTSIAAAPAAPVSDVVADGSPPLAANLVIGELPPSEQAIVAGTAQDPAGTGPPDACKNRTPHPPIRITENHGPQGFTWTHPVTGEREPRPGSGVVSGSGTEADPYLIAGWCIGGLGEPPSAPLLDLPPAILLERTSAHVVLRNNTIWDPTGGGAGIMFRDIGNATLTSNWVAGARVGVSAIHSKRISVENNRFLRNGGGMLFWHTNPIVSGNSAFDNLRYGLWIGGSKGAIIKNNTLVGGEYGITLVSSSRVEIRANIVEDSVVDLEMITSPRNRIIENEFGGGISLWGLSEGSYIQTVRRNTVNNSPLVYSAEEHDPEMPEELGQLIVVNGSSVNISAVDIDDAAIGVHVVYSEEVTIKGGELTGNRQGIRVKESRDVRVQDNAIRKSELDGVSVSLSDRTAIDNNVLARNGGAGIEIASMTGAVIRNNTVRENGEGIHVGPFSQDSVIANNTVVDNTEGIRIQETRNVTVVHNNVEENQDGIAIESSGGQVRDNHITGNLRRGIAVVGAPRDPFAFLAVRGNNLVSNTVGLAAEESRVDARHNWWGHSTGPSGGARDPCELTWATGLGDAIRALPGNVCFDPWLSHPNPDAGAN